INIKASNVNFNCNQFAINNAAFNSGTGVRIANKASNVMVSNCNINRYSVGIAANSSDAITLQNNNMTSSGIGISITNTTHPKLLGNKVISPYSGVVGIYLNRITNG